MDLVAPSLRRGGRDPGPGEGLLRGKARKAWVSCTASQAQPYSHFREPRSRRHQARGTRLQLFKRLSRAGELPCPGRIPGPIAFIWRMEGVVAFKTWVRRGRAATASGAQGRASRRARLPAHRVHFHVERVLEGLIPRPLPPQRPAGAGAPAPSSSWPAASPSSARRRARSQQGGCNWRPAEANGRLTAGRAGGAAEGAARCGAGEGSRDCARRPPMVGRVPAAPPGLRRGLASRGTSLLSGGPRRAQRPLRPCQGLRLPPGRPRVPEKCQDGTRGRRARSGSWGFAALQETPAAQAALGQGHSGEGMLGA